MASDTSMAIVADPAAAPNEVPAIPVDQDNSYLTRHDFPEGFIFGAATSSFQVEGAAHADGKSLSIWDSFSTKKPDNIDDGANGNVAADMYNRYEEDIRTMKAMGFDAYRFSIAWPRILPGGRTSAGINRAGIEYYNKLIDTVIAHGMEPFVTLFHFDLPDCLELEYGGFLSKKVVADFAEFADLCFWEFGDRVKTWTTLNEPWTVAHNGYVRGNFPPGKPSCPPSKHKNLPGHRCSNNPSKTASLERCHNDYKRDPKSNPAKDEYIVGRNLLLCHGKAVEIYRTKYKSFQRGKIGIVINSHWYAPYDPTSNADIAAAQRAMDFMGGWFLEPCLYGRYPQSMIDSVPHENLAPFTPQESEMLKGSLDYLGLNYYTANWVSDGAESSDDVGFYVDLNVTFHTERDSKPIGDDTGSSWLKVVPWGIYEHLVYFKRRYPEMPPIYITENGMSDENNHKLTAQQACRDTLRVRYHQDHLANILKAINTDKVDVKGYFVWSWCDNMEWDAGYTVRFGIIYIDFVNYLTRYPKDSAMWMAKFLKADKQSPAIWKPLSNKRQIQNDAATESEKRQKSA